VAKIEAGYANLERVPGKIPKIITYNLQELFHSNGWLKFTKESNVGKES
jgi:hypothetical protein